MDPLNLWTSSGLCTAASQAASVEVKRLQSEQKVLEAPEEQLLRAPQIGSSNWLHANCHSGSGEADISDALQRERNLAVQLAKASEKKSEHLTAADLM